MDGPAKKSAKQKMGSSGRVAKMQQQTLHALKRQASDEHQELAAICSLTQQQQQKQQQQQQTQGLTIDDVRSRSAGIEQPRPVVSQLGGIVCEGDLVARPASRTSGYYRTLNFDVLKCVDQLNHNFGLDCFSPTRV